MKALLTKLRIRKQLPAEEPKYRREVEERRVSPSQQTHLGRSIGLAIEDTSIHMAACAHGLRGRRLLAVENVPIPDELNDEHQRQSWIVDGVSQFIWRYGKRNPRISLVVSGRDTAFRGFLMPAMSRSDLNKAMRFEARKQLPFPFEGCIYGYRTLAQLQGEGRANLRMALFAATSDAVVGRLAPMEQRHIDASSVWHAPEILGDILGLLSEGDDSTSRTVVEVERHRCQISFYQGRTLEFTFTGSTGSAVLGDDSDEIQIQTFAEQLIGELQTTQDYYSGQFAKPTSERIILCGRIPHLSRVVEFIRSRSPIAFEEFPVEQLRRKLSLGDVGASEIHACLPVVAAAVSRSKLTNLLPEPMKQRHRHRHFAWIGKMTTAAALVVMIGLSALEWSRESILLRQVNHTEQRLASLQCSEAYRTYEALKRQIAIDQAYLNRVGSNSSLFHLGLKELSRLTPESIRLVSLQYSDGESENGLTLVGTVNTQDIPPEVALAEFVEALSASPAYDQVKVLRHRKKLLETGFEIEFVLGMTGVLS